MTLGTYDVEATVVDRDDDDSAVIEYTATDETTLGTLLRLPDVDSGLRTVHVERGSAVVTRRRAGITGILAAMTVALTGCTVPAQPGPQDYVGTWRLQPASGDAAARFEVADDDTYTAHDIPASIACGTEVYSGSPPGCADHRDAVDFAGKWRLSEDDSKELRFSFADLLVRKGYRDGDELGFSTRTLDAPRPDHVFTRDPSGSR